MRFLFSSVSFPVADPRLRGRYYYYSRYRELTAHSISTTTTTTTTTINKNTEHNYLIHSRLLFQLRGAGGDGGEGGL